MRWGVGSGPLDKKLALFENAFYGLFIHGIFQKTGYPREVACQVAELPVKGLFQVAFLDKVEVIHFQIFLLLNWQFPREFSRQKSQVTGK